MEQISLFSQGVIHARDFQQLITDARLPKIYQDSCKMLLEKLNLNTSLQKMSRTKLLKILLMNFLSFTERQLCVLVLMRSGLTIKEIVGSALHTPTTKANFKARSMQKWRGCRAYGILLGDGKITPELYEFLMGYPIGHSVSRCSETLSASL